MKREVELDRLARLLADRFGGGRPELAAVQVQCAWPVFKATFPDGAPMFVKLTDRAAAARTLAFLKAVAGCPFLPKPLLDDLPDCWGLAVLCLEWKESARVDAEDMTDAQAESFLAGCRQLADALVGYRGSVAPLADEDAPERQYAALRGYARRHALFGRLLKPLLDVPAAERSYGTRRLVTIHGDLQPRNYGFAGERFAAVYDTDDLTRGLACEDAAYAFTERARRSELTDEKRRRLTDLFLRLVARSPWPKDEWLIAVNHARLRIAARRLANHPNAPFVAFDIARRDRPLGRLADALRRSHA